MIERRLTIILPLSVVNNMAESDAEQEHNAERIAAVAKALESVGISTQLN